MKCGKQLNSISLARQFLLVIALILTLSVLCIHPAEGAELKGALQLTCTVERNGRVIALAGDEYAIVRIAQAEVKSDAEKTYISYAVASDWKSFDCDWGNLNTSQLREKAKTLETTAKQRGQYTAAATVNAQGTVSFDSLEPGLYLVMRVKSASANKDYTVEPFFVSIPLMVSDEIAYIVSAKPKVSWTDTPNVVPTPSDPTLPQTGQMNWPIPVLSIVGLAFILCGVFMEWKRRKPKDET